MSTLADADLDWVRRFVHERSPIAIEPAHAHLVEGRLGALAATLAIGSPTDLVARLRREANGPLGDAVVEAMTTNETSFFRDERVFDAVREILLNDVMPRRAAMRRLRVWSAASSTGQEAYSVAMLLREHAADLDAWRVEILGTDLSREVVARATMGLYSAREVERGLPRRLAETYFETDGAQFIARDELRHMVEFRVFNLCSTPAPMVAPDVVLLRNVLVYFDTDTRQRILCSIRRAMADDGWLLLGAGETIIGLDVPFERVDMRGCSCLRPIRG